MTTNEKSKDYCKADLKQRVLFIFCFSLDFSFVVLYILADLISFLEIQRLPLAGSSSTVFVANLIPYL